MKVSRPSGPLSTLQVIQTFLTTLPSYPASTCVGIAVHTAVAPAPMPGDSHAHGTSIPPIVHVPAFKCLFDDALEQSCLFSNTCNFLKTNLQTRLSLGYYHTSNLTNHRPDGHSGIPGLFHPNQTKHSHLSFGWAEPVPLIRSPPIALCQCRPLSSLPVVPPPSPTVLRASFLPPPRACPPRSSSLSHISGPPSPIAETQ